MFVCQLHCTKEIIMVFYFYTIIWALSEFGHLKPNGVAVCPKIGQLKPNGVAVCPELAQLKPNGVAVCPKLGQLKPNGLRFVLS